MEENIKIDVEDIGCQTHLAQWRALLNTGPSGSVKGREISVLAERL
jgi:hypothetical protein